MELNRLLSGGGYLVVGALAWVAITVIAVWQLRKGDPLDLPRHGQCDDDWSAHE